MPSKTTRPAKPDEAYLAQALRDAKAIYASQDDQIDEMRKIRELLDPVGVDPDLRVVDVEVRHPVLTDETFRVSATLAVNPPAHQIAAAKPGDTAQMRATAREKWDKAMLWVAGKNSGRPNTYKLAIDAAVADGGAWTKFLVVWNLWDERNRLKLDSVDEVTVKGEYEKDGKPKREKRAKFADDDGYTQWRAERLLASGKPRRARVKDQDLEETEEDEDTKERKVKERPRSREEKFMEAVDEAKRKAMPFRWMHVDARTVYPVFHGDRLVEVFEVTKRPYTSTFREHRLKRSRDGTIFQAPDDADVTPEDVIGQGVPEEDSEQSSGWPDSILWIEHWTKEHCTYAVLGSKAKSGSSVEETCCIVDQFEHSMNRPPYFFSPGLWMSHWANRKVGWGIGESKRWLVKYLSYLLTVHANAAARDVFVPLQRVYPDQAAPYIGDDQRRSVRGKGSAGTPEKWSLTRIYTNRPGEELRPIAFPEVMGALREQIALIKEMIESLLTPRVANQIGAGVEGAGFAIAQLLAEGRIRHDPIAQGIEEMLDEVSRFSWDLVRNVVKEGVPVYYEATEDTGWVEVGPEELEDAVTSKWTVNAETPSAEMVKVRYVTERLSNETMSIDQAVDFLGDNPDEVRVSRAIDEIRKSDWYKAYLVAMILGDAGRGDLLVEASSAEQMAATGAVPGPGGPPGMPPGMGGDPGNLSMAPGGVGAAPVSLPTSGSVAGVGPGAVVPQQGAEAMLQSLGS